MLHFTIVLVYIFTSLSIESEDTRAREKLFSQREKKKHEKRHFSGLYSQKVAKFAKFSFAPRKFYLTMRTLSGWTGKPPRGDRLA
jgi:hypothetical protein